jgi:hypothetical protein
MYGAHRHPSLVSICDAVRQPPKVVKSIMDATAEAQAIVRLTA